MSEQEDEVMGIADSVSVSIKRAAPIPWFERAGSARSMLLSLTTLVRVSKRRAQPNPSFSILG